MMVKVGQRVTRTPKTIGVLDDTNFGTKLQAKPMRGVVVYVHPKGRFHVVEFENLKGEKIRETFDGV
jgi:hypothetical protein